MQQQLHDADNHQQVSKDGILILFNLVRVGGFGEIQDMSWLARCQYFRAPSWADDSLSSSSSSCWQNWNVSTFVALGVARARVSNKGDSRKGIRCQQPLLITIRHPGLGKFDCPENKIMPTISITCPFSKYKREKKTKLCDWNVQYSNGSQKSRRLPHSCQITRS